MDPVDGEVTACGLGSRDEVATQLGPGRLWRGVLGDLDLAVVGDPADEALALQQVEDAAATTDVVVGQIELRDARAGQVEVVLVPVALDQPVLDRPVDFGVDLAEVLLLDRVQRAAPQLDDALVRRGRAVVLDVLSRGRGTRAGCPAPRPRARRPAAPGGGR